MGRGPPWIPIALSALNCLYDDGARDMCGRGTRAFDARAEGEGATLVIKDCWLEDRQDRTLEHVIVEGVRGAVGKAEFRSASSTSVVTAVLEIPLWTESVRF